MKNIVFIPNVKGTDEKRLREVAYDLSVKSWKYWCEKNGCELVVMNELVHDYDEMKITWQRYYVLEILENSNIENTSLMQKIAVLDDSLLQHKNQKLVDITNYNNFI